MGLLSVVVKMAAVGVIAAAASPDPEGVGVLSPLLADEDCDSAAAPPIPGIAAGVASAPLPEPVEAAEDAVSVPLGVAAAAAAADPDPVAMVKVSPWNVVVCPSVASVNVTCGFCNTVTKAECRTRISKRTGGGK